MTGTILFVMLGLLLLYALMPKVSQALLENDSKTFSYRDAAARVAGEVVQLPDGKAGVRAGLAASAAGDTNGYEVAGRFRFAKAATWVALPGIPIYWDRSANVAMYKQDVNSGDFFLGTCARDAASTDTEVVVDLNVTVPKLIEWGKGIWDSVAVKTAGTVIPNIAAGLSGQDPGGTGTRFTFSATSEAQKVDALSKQSIPVTVPFIARGRIAIFDIGDNAALDISVGLANATHATDADSITESCFLHLDGNALDIYAESDDGTTEVAATDTTINAVDDTYFEFWIDGRDLADIQIYINGSLVLASTVFKLDAATGPLKMLLHLEKTTDNTLADVRVEALEAWTMELEA